MQLRKRYSKEFKLDAVSLVFNQGYSRIEVARSLGINHKMLGRSAKEFVLVEGRALRGDGKLSPKQAKIRQLKEDNRWLKTEKEILIKATVFFAKETT